jgi:DNA-directed RNA polymerase subunit K/omega
MISLLSEELADRIFIGPPKLTRFERARIIGARALQISLGAPVLIELQPDVTDPIEIARRELEEGILPITIRRTLPDGTFQDIPLIDLIKPREERRS